MGRFPVPERRSFNVLAMLVLLVALAATGRAAASEADPLQLRVATELDLSAAVFLSDVEIEIGPGVFAVRRGLLVPSRVESGRALELFFVGQARFLLDPPDSIEAGQLELFTGERALDVSVEEAVLVLAHESAVRELLDRSPSRALRPSLVDRVRALHGNWIHGPERRVAGIDASLLKVLSGDGAFTDYFGLWGSSFELGSFVFQLDPEDIEQITLASFRRPEMSNWERARLRHEIRVQQRKGRWVGLRVQDVGSWDIWISMPWSPRHGKPLPGSSGFEAEHYVIDATMRGRHRRLTGRAELTLRVEQDDRRAIRMELMRDLVVEQVRDAEDRPLDFYRSGEELVVVLPRAPEKGSRMVVSIDYAGKALKWVRGKTFDLNDTSHWYPHCGTVDRATYDVTLRWPAGQDLIAGGELVESGRDKGMRWERRELKHPAIAYSFVLGRFDVELHRIGDLKVKLAFDRTAERPVAPEVREEVFERLREAFLFLEQTYGTYPLDHLTLVTVPRGYSQSYLGFVTLADSTIHRGDPMSPDIRWQRSTTIAHELAHQWWGNLVGWWSYRDQWLSEGMANYSALIFDAHRNGQPADRLSEMAAGWRDSLSRRTLEGRTIESLGPVVLGNRLNSSRARNGYRTIVYRKGGVVLAMLARAVGEQAFREMLGTLAEAATNREMTTDSFLRSLEKMSGLELDGFARQYIYGTGIPEVFYDYRTVEASAGGWNVEGEARLLTAPHFRHRIVRDEDGAWDVERQSGFAPDLGPTTLMVPYRLDLAEERSSEVDAEATVGLIQRGQLLLEGQADDFLISTTHEPLDLRLDPRGEVLASFYDSDRQPKRALRYEAEGLALDGDYASAAERFRQALEIVGKDDRKVDPLRSKDGSRFSSREEDLAIRLALVRLEILEGRDESALERLDGIERELDEAADRAPYPVERTVLRARLDKRRGAAGEAHKRLKKTLRQVSPKAPGTMRGIYRRWQLGTERIALAEAFALLAVSSWELQNRSDFFWAVREARDRGVDIAELVQETGTTPFDLRNPPDRSDSRDLIEGTRR